MALLLVYRLHPSIYHPKMKSKDCKSRPGNIYFFNKNIYF